MEKAKREGKRGRGKGKGAKMKGKWEREKGEEMICIFRKKKN